MPSFLHQGEEIGAGDESRTRDLNLGKVALYQLSYSRIQRCVFLSRKSGGAKRNRTAVDGFAIRCITTLLSRRPSGAFPAFWSGRRVSNSRPQPWQGCALPTELLPRSLEENAHFTGTENSVKPQNTKILRLPADFSVPAVFSLFFSEGRQIFLLFFSGRSLTGRFQRFGGSEPNNRSLR